MTREPSLAGQVLLVIGGSSGIGLETARRAHAEGADVIITGRDPEGVHRAGIELEASIAAFDATDFERLGRFLQELPSIDHVMVTGPGPQSASLASFGLNEARRDLEAHLLLPLQLAREGASKIRPGGTLLFTGCANGRHAIARLAFLSAITAALSAMARSLAAELAPVRVNVIAPGFVDTPVPAAVLGNGLDGQRDELKTTLRIRRPIEPDDVAALAVHLMTNTAVTGATFEIDGGQHLVER